MNTFPKNEIKKVNNILHKIFGCSFIEVENCKLIATGEQFISGHNRIYKESTLAILKDCSDEKLFKLYKILNFYYPRWIAYNCIKNINNDYSEDAANNELFLALTSVIDYLNKYKWVKEFKIFFKKYTNKTEIDAIENIKEIKKENFKKKDIELDTFDDLADYIYKLHNINKKVKKGLFGDFNSNVTEFFDRKICCTDMFIEFLKNNLDKEEIKKISQNFKVYKKGKTENLKSLADLGNYIYDIRSKVVHEAELEGVYPYYIDLKNKCSTIPPKDFRELLWKAIFNYLGLKIIY